MAAAGGRSLVMLSWRLSCRPLRLQSVSIKRNGTPALGVVRCYTRGSQEHEILPYHAKRRSRPVRFLNPWVDLANATPDDVLAIKVESVTRTFGVVAALMCSLSAAALAVTPEPQEEEEEEDSVTMTDDQQEEEAWSILDHVVYKEHVAGTSLLVSWGVAPSLLSEYYSACCAGSFYSSVCAMGLSAVINAWLACTPPGGTKHFVRYHSLVICSMPGFLAVSIGLAGVALFIGLDISKGTPISYIGLGGTALGGLLIGTSTVRGMVCTYRLLNPLVRKF